MKQRVHINFKKIIPILLVYVIIISTASVALFSLLNKDNGTPTVNTPDASSNVSIDPIPVEKRPISSFKSILVVPGDDFLTEAVTEAKAKEEIDSVLSNIRNDGFDTVELTLNYNGGLIFPVEGFPCPAGNLLEYFYNAVKASDINVVTVVDIAALAEKTIVDPKDIERICSVLSSEALGKYSDMLVLRNCYITPDSISESEYSASRRTVTYEEYINKRLDDAVKNFYFAAVKADAAMALGIEINESECPENAVQNVGDWLKNGSADFAVLYDPYSTDTDDISFMTYYETVRERIGASYTDLHCKLAYDKIGSKEKGWEQTDQILHQLKALDTMGVTGFVLDSYGDFVKDTTESREAVKKYMADLITNDYILRELSISKPEKKTFTTSEKTILLAGASDPEFKLTLNGNVLERSELGYFSVDLELKDGSNTFVIEHKGVSETYKITYKRTIIKEISPTSKTTLPSQSILLVSCTAISGSNVSAKLGDIEVALTEAPIFDANGNSDSEYSNYSGRINLPTVYDEDVSLGKISFTAKSKYGTDTKTGGNVNIIKEERPKPPEPSQPSVPSDITSSGSTVSGSENPPSGGDAWVMPNNGKYVDVGTNYVAEVINWQAETFSSTDDSDYSKPTNNYLPKGTVDYCSAGVVSSSGGAMKILRYGNMIYGTSSKGVKTLKIHDGITLPDHNTVNTVGVGNTGRHTQITFDVLWKAPFRFDLAPQKYTDERNSNRDYTISSATFDHIDITFCYATLVTGEVVIPESDPVFSKAEWINNGSDYTLRLHLKKKGMFYGWSAEYNEAGQLVFSFLNPAKITAAENDYGYRLDGIVIAIDVGHGGKDCGALGSNKDFSESVLNLTLAEKLKSQLESLGATVVMTRYDNDSNPSSDERMKLLRTSKADYCIAIHRNASDRSAPQGFMSYHFNAFSSNAAKLVYKATEKAQLYKKDKWYGTKWHYFYTCRQTDCPVVLTENGFMTNPTEFSDMIRDDFNLNCAKALTQGIVDYFKSIQ